MTKSYKIFKLVVRNNTLFNLYGLYNKHGLVMRLRFCLNKMPICMLDVDYPRLYSS